MDQPTVASGQGHDVTTRPGVPPTLLTQEDIDHYHRDGFVIPKFRLSNDEIVKLRTLILRLVTENPAWADHVMNSPHIPGSGVQGLKSFPGWMEFAAHPTILDMIEQIIGPDIILWGSAVFYKRQGSGPATPWHRDAIHLPITPLQTTSVWIAASDSRIDNSCLRYIPGSHKAKAAGKHTQQNRKDLSFGLTIDGSEFDEGAAVDIELEAGQMVLFDIFTIHGSRHNLGDRERSSFALRFMPGTSRYDHDAAPDELRKNGYGHHTRPLMLVRGVDRAGNDFTRGHPEAGQAAL